MSEVEDYFENSQLQAKQSNVAALDDDPEQAARAITLGGATGVPPTAIYGDLDGFERAHKAQLSSAIIHDNEYIADYLNSNPMAPRVSHDDLGALDDHSRALSNLQGGTKLTQWLEKTLAPVATSFKEGFGEQKFGQQMFQRPSDVEWAISHPAAASLAGAVSMPVEGLARVTGGLLHMGYDGVSQIFGEKFAREMIAMAEWGMMRGDLGVKAGMGPAEIVEGNSQLLKQIHSGMEIADVYKGQEPPVGVHPLIDDAKKLQTKEDLDGLSEALKTAQQSATRERAPDLFADFVRGHVGDREIGISSDAVRRLYGDKLPTTDDNILGWIPNLDTKLAAAEGTGGDVRVPLADWLAMVEPDVAKELHDDIRLRDGGLTVNDTKIGSDIEEPERLVGAAIKVGDEVFSAPIHAMALEDALKKYPDFKPNASDHGGFLTSTGRYIRRNEATEIAKKAEQIKPEAEMLHGGNVIDAASVDYNPAKHPRPEPKETIAEPITTTRGSAGLEPMFSVGDRKIKLERMQPKTAEDLLSLPQGVADNFHDFDMVDETGQKIGSLNLSEQKGGRQVYVEMIQAGPREKKFYDPNYLGPSVIRDIARQLKAEFPKAFGPDGLGITGHRVTGARDKAGTYDLKSAMPVVKFEQGEDPQAFRDLMTPYWEDLGHGVQALFAEDGKGLAADHPVGQMVLDELHKIVPDAESDIAHRIEAPQGRMGGVYMPNMRSIIVSLESRDPLATARHEAIHALVDLGLLDDRELTTLRNAVQSEGWYDKFNVKERWQHVEHADLNEEAIAEAYKNWARGDLMPPEVHTIFEKIKAFLDGLLQKLNEKLGGDLSWQQIFEKIDSGEIGGREAEGAERTEPSFEAGEEGGLYDRGKALGVTQSHMDRMLKLIEKRNAEDHEAALKRAEVRQRRRSNKEWKERRTVLRDEVREDLQNRPDLAMDQLMSKNKIKIDPATLSEDQKLRLPKDYIQKKDGVNPDDLAPYFGYTSGDAMVERLGMLTEDRRRSGMSARDYFNRLVDVETDRRLNTEFGDRQQRVLDEAKDQALSETQLNLVHEETLAYALKAGQEPQFTRDETRRMVKSVFDQTPVGQISSDRLLQKAGTIGRKIEEAGAKGDWAEAYRLSQQRNHAVIAAKLAREYERQRAQLDRTAKQFRKREVASVPAEYTNWVHDLLQRSGYAINRSIQDLDENIGLHSEDTLEKFVDAKEAEWMGLRELPIADPLLDPAYRAKVDDLSHRDFIGLKSSIDALIKAGRDEGKIYREGEAGDRATVLSEMREKLKTFPMKEFPATRGTLSRAADYPRAFMAGMTNIETLLNRWDRADPNGIFNRYVNYPLAKASNYKNVLQPQYDKALRDLKPIEDRRKLVDAPFVDPLSRTEENPNGTTWSGFTRGNVMAMLQNAGNKSNWNVLSRGYGADPEALLQWLHRNTTKEDWDRAQSMGDTVFKPLVATADRVYERLTGASIEKIPLEKIQTPFGEYAGWYHPLIADPLRKEVWEQHPETGEWNRRATGRKSSVYDDDYGHTSTANGYTKKRTGATYPLDLNFDAIPARIRQMIHDAAFRETILETQKVFDNKAFQAEVTKHYGPIYTDLLMPYLRAMAGAESINSKAGAMAGKVSEYFRQNVISTLIGFNPYTALKHGPTAWVMSMKEVGGKDFLRAVTSLYGKSPELGLSNSEFAMKWSEELQRRERHWQDTIAGEHQLLGEEVSTRAKVVQAGSWLVAQSDMMSAKPTWMAQYEKSLRDGSSHGDAVDLADRAVRRAHGSTAATNQPALVRGGGPLHGWLTSVYGFFGTAMQRRIEIAHELNDTYGLVKDGEISKAGARVPSIAQNIFTYVIWPTIVEEWVTGLTTDDRRGWGQHLTAGAFMGLSSSVLYLRDMMHAAVTGQDPSVGLINTPLHDVMKVYNHVRAGRKSLDRQHAGKTVADTLTVFGEMSGLAPKTVDNAIRFGIDLVNKQAHPKNLNDYRLGLTRGSEKRRVEK